MCFLLYQCDVYSDTHSQCILHLQHLAKKQLQFLSKKQKNTESYALNKASRDALQRVKYTRYGHQNFDSDGFIHNETV